MIENKDYKVVNLFRCEHCQEFHCDKIELLEDHLNECIANPRNKSCLMCKNLLQHNVIESGKPLRYYECTKNKQILDDFDIMMLGAECFQERENKQVSHKNSEEYTSYLMETVEKINKTIE